MIQPNQDPLQEAIFAAPVHHISNFWLGYVPFGEVLCQNKIQ
jgi:hypothetical protein